MENVALQTETRKTAFYLLGGMFLAVIVLRLGPALLAGFISYLVLDLLHRLLLKRFRPFYARWIAFTVFLATAAVGIWLLFIFLRQSLAAMPAILEKAFPKLNELSQLYGLDLNFTNMEELRDSLLQGLKKNAGAVNHFSRLLTLDIFHLFVGCFVAILVFLDKGRDPQGPSLFDALRVELTAQIRKFNDSFERVVGARVVVSAINCGLTAIFLFLMGFPYLPFLVLASFLLGILPIVGNLMTNTIIVFTGLTLSPRHALFALIFLVLIHKGEYFLNSKILGANIRLPMWLILLGIVVGHTVMGVPGIVLAPALLHYVKGRLREVPGENGTLKKKAR